MRKPTSPGEITRRSAIELLALFFGSTVPAPVASTATAAESGSALRRAHQGPWHDTAIARLNFISIMVLIDGRQVSALVDTGATRSFISKQLALDLGLAENGVVSGYGLTAAISGVSYLVTSIQIDGLRFSNLTLGSYSLANLAGLVPIEVPLIIGRDVLDRLLVEIDFPRSRIRFSGRIGDFDRRQFERIGLHDNHAGILSFDVRFGSAAPAQAALDFGGNVERSSWARCDAPAGPFSHSSCCAK